MDLFIDHITYPVQKRVPSTKLIFEVSVCVFTIRGKEYRHYKLVIWRVFYGRPEHSPNSVTICGNFKSRPHAGALGKAVAKGQGVPVLAFGDNSVCLPHMSLGLKIHSLLSSSNSTISLLGTGPC